MRLGIFGGSFDPPHVGHLIVADDAAAALGIDRLLFVPVGDHPLKQARVEAPADVRLEMVEAATASSESFEPDGREVRRPGPSYTVDTVAALQMENPGAELVLLVGADIVAEFHRWRRLDEIARRARIAVMSRADAPAVEASVDVRLETIEVTHVAISSSAVRERVRTGKPYRYLVPGPVYEIIERRSLYRNRADGE
ncbi:MAG: nicotinate-nucleotide adenylyltransferase [Gemmatimonadales bacterium]|jgi:nicotinate-nucleotide adenylyltransferase